MTINQIECFIAIVESDTFLEASEILNISQSSLSKQIMSLEKELDLKLFDRSKRSASLTEAGTVFYKDAMDMLEMYKQMKSHLHPFSESYRECIHLGTLPFLTQYNLTSPLKHFSAESPGIQLIIDEVEDEHLMYGLQHGEYDLVITRSELASGEKYKTYNLTDDKLTLLTSKDHPLAGCTSIALQDLAQEDFILMHKHISIYHLCINSCKKKGFSPNVIRTARIESILSAVEANEGISLLCEKNIGVFNYDNIAVIPLEDPITTTVVLARMKKTKIHPGCKKFISYLKNYYEI